MGEEVDVKGDMATHTAINSLRHEFVLRILRAHVRRPNRFRGALWPFIIPKFRAPAFLFGSEAITDAASGKDAGKGVIQGLGRLRHRGSRGIGNVIINIRTCISLHLPLEQIKNFCFRRPDTGLSSILASSQKALWYKSHGVQNST